RLTATTHSATTTSAASSELFMGVGSGRIADSVLEAMAVQPPAADDPAFLEAFAECLMSLRTVLGISRGQAFVIPGSGTHGMEMLAVSLLRPGSRAVVGCTGRWGERWAEICRRHGIHARCVVPSPGESVRPAHVARVVSDIDADALLLTHVDPSTGVRVDVEACAAACRRSGALVMVDGVCAAGAEVVRQNDWGVDLYLTTGQRGLGVPGGLILMGAGDRAIRRLRAREWSPRTYSLDLQPWLGAMDAIACETPSYHQSPAGNLVLALREGLRLVLAEGLDQRAARHAVVANVLRAGLEVLGFLPVVPNPEARALGISVCYYPKGRGREFLDLVRRFGVRLRGGTHPTLGERTFQIGHLGNVGVVDAGRTLESLAKASGGPSGSMRAGDGGPDRTTPLFA
ncbi:MAG: pyridoxal-phosphate-dependent aminotransferase family protein, partial [Nocardioidaceae bacterium]